MLHASCFMLHASCFMLHASCFMLHASCFMLHVCKYETAPGAVCAGGSCDGSWPSIADGARIVWGHIRVVIHYLVHTPNPGESEPHLVVRLGDIRFRCHRHEDVVLVRTDLPAIYLTAEAVFTAG